MADFKVTGEAEISPDKIVENIDEILEKLDKFAEKVDELDEKLDELSRKSVNIDVVIDGMDRLDELKLFLDELEDKEYIVKVVIGDVIGNDRLDVLRADLDELTARDHKVNVKVDVDGMVRAKAAVDALSLSMSKNKKAVDDADKSTEAFKFSWMMLLPLLIPAAGILAILAGAALGVASAFLTMAIPVAAMALATKSAYTEITTFASTLSNQVTAAISKSGSNFKEINAILDKNSSAFRNMNQNMKDAVVGYFELKNAIATFQSAVQPETMGILTDGMAALRELLKDITPSAQQAGKALYDLIGDFANRLQDPTFQKFFNDMDKNVYTLVTDWGEGVLNIIEGIVAIADAFMPLGVTISGGFLSMTQSFDTWAQHLAESQGFKKFVSEVETDGPILLNVLGQLFILIGHLFGALNNTGQVGGFLTVMDKLLKAANDFMKAHPAFTQFALDLLLVGGAASKLIPMLGPLLSFFMSPPGLIIAGIAGLAIAFYEAYKNSKQFHDWVNSNLVPLLHRLGNDVSQVKTWFVGIWPDIEKVWQKYGKNIENIVLDALKGVEGIFEGAIEFIEGIVEVFLGIMTGKWHLTWDGFGKILGGAWKIIFNLLSGFLKILGNMAAMAWTQLSTDFSSAWDGIYRDFKKWGGEMETAALDFFDNLVGKAVTGMANFMNKIETDGAALGVWFKNLPGNIVKWLGNLSGLLFNAGKAVMQGFLNGLKSLWGDVKSFFGDLTSMIPDVKGPPATDKTLLTNNGALIMQSLIDGFESKYAAVENNLQGFTKTIQSKYGSQFTKDISAQLSASVNNVNSAVDRPLGSGGNIQNSGGQNITIASGAITIYNPTPEPASQTLTRTLQGFARWGSIETPSGFDSKAAMR